MARPQSGVTVAVVQRAAAYRYSTVYSFSMGGDGHASRWALQVPRMDDLLRSLLDALDFVGQSHEEIYDIVCREKMGDAIACMFIKPDPDYVVPDEFGLYAAAANLAVKEALVTYTTAAKKAASEQGINSFHERLAAFQNAEVESSVERNCYDDFFGWMNPKNFDKAGNVVRNN